MRVVGVLVIAALYVVLGHRYAPVFASERALWSYVHRIDPMNPRATINDEKARWAAEQR